MLLSARKRFIILYVFIFLFGITEPQFGWSVEFPRYHPVITSSKRPIYYPNNFADPITGQKYGWFTSLSTKQPKYGMWLNQEHSIIRTGTNKWLLVAMETNRNYLSLPNPAFVDAYKFLEYDDSILDVPSTPTFQMGYWRGNTLSSHEYVWAPYVFEENGIYYLFYNARNPATGMSACYLATSTTGSANPADWIQYDPNLSTPGVIEPLFNGVQNTYIKDIHVIKVQTNEGPKYYCYYIANVIYNEIALGISEVRLRISDNLLNWPDSTELPDPAFRKLNFGETIVWRLNVDYENPGVYQYDDGSFYLFVSRHGVIPADFDTNPNWVPIPVTVEVFWSADGKYFDPNNELPSLRTPDGFNLNAAEIIKDGGKWYATHAAGTNDPQYFEYDWPPGDPNPNEHSPLLLKLLQYNPEPYNAFYMVDMTWELITSATCWELYQ